MNDEFTPEEQSALSAMEADTAPVETTEPVVAAEPKPEAPATETPPTAESEPAKPPEGFVPHGALHQERAKRQALEAEFNALKEKIAAIEAAKAQTPLEVPDPILEPEKFREFQLAQIKAQEDRWAKAEEQNRQVATQQQRIQTVQRLEQEFAAETPDYNDAVSHVIAHRTSELRMYGYADDQIKQIISQDANAIFDGAIQRGENPAKVLYNVAKLRGYGGQAPASQIDADKLRALQSAQANTGSLATAGGPSQQGGYTMQQLAKMSEAELAAIPEPIIRKVMGG